MKQAKRPIDFALNFEENNFRFRILKFVIATWMSNKRQLVLNVIICPNVQVLLRWEGKSNYRTTCAREEGGKILRKQAKEPSSWCELLCSISMTSLLERSKNVDFRQLNWPHQTQVESKITKVDSKILKVRIYLYVKNVRLRRQLVLLKIFDNLHSWNRFFFINWVLILLNPNPTKKSSNTVARIHSEI